MPMQDALSAEGQAHLSEVFRLRTLVAFDFDGTLAPIVAEPGAAVLRRSTRTQLTLLSKGRPCAVISGRAWDDVAGRPEGTGIHDIVGNHGIEPWFATESWEQWTEQTSRHFSEVLGSIPGVIVENKRYSISIHFRAARNRAAARAVILELALRVEGVRVVDGKSVVNVLPADAPGKAAALGRLRETLGCEHAIYVGDDTTDEAAFAAGPWVTGIRVGRSERSKAGWYLEEQSAIDDLLATIESLGALPPTVLN